MIGRIARAALILSIPLMLSAHSPVNLSVDLETLPCLQIAQQLAQTTRIDLCELGCMEIWENRWEPAGAVCYRTKDQICVALLIELGCPPCSGGPE